MKYISIRWRSCCGSTACSSFTISVTRAWRTCSTRQSRSGASSDSGCRTLCPTRPPFSTFGHLLERDGLGEGIFEEINAHLDSQGLRLREGTIVDASIIEAPSSTKNRAGERDPEMHQTKKGNQWYFGMKVHIGVDADTGLVHSMTTTAANTHDVTEAHRLLHGGETVVWGDAGYQGVGKREENLGREVDWQVAMRPGRRRKLEPGSDEALTEKLKASVRARVEHPFLYVKRRFGYARVRYRGLAKNTERLAALLGFGNLLDGGASSGRVAWAAEGSKGPMEPLPVHNGPDGAKPKGWSYRQQRAEGSSHPPLPLQLRQSKP